jgi:sterol desaturase/sphingolipid hydroxylase (fatty acid hydroxylase superfamily)
LDVLPQLALLFDIKMTLIVVLVFLPFERVLPRNPKQPLWRKDAGNDLIYLLLNGAIIRLMILPIVVLLAQARGWLNPAALTQAIGSQPLWLQSIEAIILADLGFYLAHRLFHAVPFFWRFHAIHHSIEDLDWLATFRVHPLDQLVSSTASLAPLILLGFPDAAMAVYAAIYRWHSVLLHSNLRLAFGRLGLVVATPEFHSWHHSRTPEAWDKNFAGQFALWDVIFGTAYLPRGAQSLASGIDLEVPRKYPDQLAFPFRRS